MCNLLHVQNHFATGLENIIQCILSVKLDAAQIFLFDGQA